jgi:hypothetical protein
MQTSKHPNHQDSWHGLFFVRIYGTSPGGRLTARQVFELVVPDIINAQLQDTCASLINFITGALMQPMDESVVSLTGYAQAGKSGYAPGPMAINYRREHILYHDLPALYPVSTRPAASDQAMVDIARGMRGMVAEARADNRDEARRPNSVREKMGDTMIDHLLLMWRASNDDELSPLYHE